MLLATLLSGVLGGGKRLALTPSLASTLADIHLGGRPYCGGIFLTSALVATAGECAIGAVRDYTVLSLNTDRAKWWRPLPKSKVRAIRRKDTDHAPHLRGVALLLLETHLPAALYPTLDAARLATQPGRHVAILGWHGRHGISDTAELSPGHIWKGEPRLRMYTALAKRQLPLYLVNQTGHPLHFTSGSPILQLDAGPSPILVGLVAYPALTVTALPTPYIQICLFGDWIKSFL